MSVPRFTLYTGDESDSKLFSKRYGYFVRAIDKADGEVDCFQATAIVSSDEQLRPTDEVYSEILVRIRNRFRRPDLYIVGWIRGVDMMETLIARWSKSKNKSPK